MEKKTNEKEFKVGDKVKVKDDLVVGNRYGGLTWYETMDNLKGEVLTISYVDGKDIRVNESYSFLKKEMLEHIEEDKPKTRIETALENKEKVIEVLGEVADIFTLTNESIKKLIEKHYCPSEFGLNEDDYCTREYLEDKCYKCWNRTVGEDNFTNDIEVSEIDEEEYDPIKPLHYNSGEFDVIAFCIKHNLDFVSGNVIKYVVRAGKKDKSKELEDLQKAQEYLRRKMETLKGGII